MKTPADWRRRGFGNLLAVACLSDPRRRVRNDAYYDDASDDRLGGNCQSEEVVLHHGRLFVELINSLEICIDQREKANAYFNGSEQCVNNHK